MFKVSTSLEHACLQLLTKVLDSPATGFWGRSFQIISSQRCSIVDGLLSSSFCLWNCKIVMLTTQYLRYQFNSETCRRCYLTDAYWFYLSIRMALRLTAHATQDGLHATAMTLLRSMYGHQTCQILIRFIIICGVPWLKPITSWISQAGQLSHKQLRSFLLCVW